METYNGRQLLFYMKITKAQIEAFQWSMDTNGSPRIEVRLGMVDELGDRVKVVKKDEKPRFMWVKLSFPKK